MQTKTPKSYPKLGGCWLSRPIKGSDIFYINWPVPDNAKRTCRKSTGTVDEGLAEVHLAEFVSARSKPVKAEEEELQVAVALKRYWDEYGSTLPSAHTIEYGIRKAMEFFGTDAVGDLSKARQEAFIKARRADGVSDATINKSLTFVRASLKREWENQRLKSVPFIMSLEDNSPETPIYTLAQMRAMIERSKAHHHFFRFVMLSCNTLSRPCAILDLRPAQNDFESKLIDLNPAGRKQTKKFRPIVPMTSTILPLLQEWIVYTQDGAPYVNWMGRPIKRMGKLFSKMINDSGKLPVTQYSIRHSMATFLSRDGIDEDQIARELGHNAHKTTKTTRRYLHHSPSYLSEVRDGIDDLMGRLLSPAPIISIGPKPAAKPDNVVQLKRKA